MLVSIVTPTTDSRAAFSLRLKSMIDQQDYPEIQHIEVKHDLPIGEKRNIGCSLAQGEVILFMDDDDIYAPDWVSKSVAALLDSNAAVVGLSSAYFYDATTHRLYQWDYYASIPRPTQPYVNEATMCFWKNRWEEAKFAATSNGEGRNFLANVGKCVSHQHINKFIAIIHGNNTICHKAIPHMRKVDIAPVLLSQYYKTVRVDDIKNVASVRTPH